MSRHSLDLKLAAHGPEHAATAGARANLACCTFQLGRYSDALSGFHEALQVLQAKLPAGHPDIAWCRVVTAEALQATGRHAEAEAQLAQAQQALLLASGGADSADLVMVRRVLGRVLTDTGSFDAAAEALGQALAGARTLMGPSHEVVASCLLDLAVLRMRRRGSIEEARRDAEDAVSILASAGGSPNPSHPSRSQAQVVLAEAMLRQALAEGSATGAAAAAAVGTAAADAAAAAAAAASAGTAAAALEASLGAQHDKVAVAKLVSAWALLVSGDAKEAQQQAALQQTQTALDTLTAAKGRMHPSTLYWSAHR